VKGGDSSSGETFFISTTEFRYAKYGDRPTVGLLVPPVALRHGSGREANPY